MKKYIFKLSIFTLLFFQILTLNACLFSDADGPAGTETGLDDVDDPISLPVTTAKLEYGIDPESLTMILSVPMADLVSGENLNPDSVIGTISGRLEIPVTALVGIKVNNVYVDTVQATDGVFSYSLLYQYYNVDVSFVVFGEGSSPTNEALVSSPVIVKVSYNSDESQLIMTAAVPLSEIASDETTSGETSSSTDDNVIVNTIILGESETSVPEEVEPSTPLNTTPSVNNLNLDVGLDSLGRVYPNPVQEQQISLSVTDADGNTLVYSIVDSPTLGSASFSDNVLTYTPAVPFEGPDTFTYKSNDGQVDSNIATVTVTSDAISAETLASTSFTSFGTILTYQSGTFAATYGVQAGTVAYDAVTGDYTMYFESQVAAADGVCQGGYWSIGRATSTDGGATWTHDTNPVLSPTAGTNYACSLGQPAVVYDGSQYHLFVATKKTGSTTPYLAYSSSVDGTTFSAPVSLLSGSIGFPSAILVDGRLSVYYYQQSGASYYINRMWSDDTDAAWNSANVNSNMISTLDAWSAGTLFANTTRIITHSTFYDSADAEAPYKMYIIGVNTAGSTSNPSNPYYVGGLLESADGVVWGLSSTLPVVANPTWYWHHEILLHGHNYLMFYKTRDGSSKAVIDFATTYSVWP